MAARPPISSSWPSRVPTDPRGLFALERERLLDLLASLSATEWDLPTPCPGWSVLGLARHLLGEDLGLLARQRDDYHGTHAPSTDEEGFIQWLDDHQAEWVAATRRLSPRLVTDLLAWSGPQVDSMFASQDLLAVTASVSWAGPDPVPVWLEQLRDVSEFWIHRQQILESLGKPSDLRADVAAPVIDGLRWAYPYRLSALSGREGDTVTIRVGGPVERRWYLVATDDHWQYLTEPGRTVVATMDLSTEQLWRLLTNNLPADQQAGLAISGDQSFIHVLRRTRAIIGRPL